MFRKFMFKRRIRCGAVSRVELLSEQMQALQGAMEGIVDRLGDVEEHVNDAVGDTGCIMTLR